MGLLGRCFAGFSRADSPVFSDSQQGRLKIMEGRRSERVLVDVPVIVRGQSIGEGSFQEETFTVTVSAHGAMVMLAAKVALGQSITLVRLNDSAERACRIAYRGRDHAGLAQVGLEFCEPSPGFWPVDAPTSWLTA